MADRVPVMLHVASQALHTAISNMPSTQENGDQVASHLIMPPVVMLQILS